MIIDSHQHVVLPPEKQLQWMAEGSIDKVILFASTIHPETAKNLTGVRQELNRLYTILNGATATHLREEKIASLDQLSDVIAQHPQRYVGFGNLPIGMTYEENGEWIERQILARGFRGIGELAPGTGKVKKLEPLFQAAQENGKLPLWVHTFIPFQLEDIKELLALAKKYPEVPLIMGHLGGLYWVDTLEAVKEIPNVYLDLSAVYTTMAPYYAIHELPERTLFSSDAPYSLPKVSRMMVEELIKDPAIRRQVLGENIAGLLELTC